MFGIVKLYLTVIFFMTFALCFLTLVKELKQRQRLVQTNDNATTSSIHGRKIIMRTFYVPYFVKKLKITFFVLFEFADIKIGRLQPEMPGKVGDNISQARTELLKEYDFVELSRKAENLFLPPRYKQLKKKVHLFRKQCLTSAIP